MHIPIFVILDRRREALLSDAAAHDHFLGWRRSEPALAEVDDLDGLLRLANNRTRLTEGDAVLAVLARRAPKEPMAAEVLLQSLLPGLKRLVRTCHPVHGADDFASEAVTVALERIQRYPFDRRPQRIAANIIRDVRQQLWRRHEQHRRLADRVGQAVPFDEARIADPTVPSPTQELVDLVTEGVRTGDISPRGGRLILLYRVLGVSTRELARSEGRKPDAVERTRQRAEADLAAAIA